MKFTLTAFALIFTASNAFAASDVMIARVRDYLASGPQNVTTLASRCLSFASTPEPNVVVVQELHDSFCGGDPQTAPTVAIFQMNNDRLYIEDSVTGQAHLVIENPGPVFGLGGPAGEFTELLEDHAYRNSKFNFSVTFPKPLFMPGVESDSHDGITAQSADGHAVLLAYGSYGPQVFNKTLQDMYQEELQTPNRTVTYKALETAENFYVVSGLVQGRVFYTKTYVIDGVEKSIQLRYDLAFKAIYDQATTKISLGFHSN